ncbi:MAG: MG2 domain-containing protein [Acidobacteriota bacterium]|nr:MG2 domain-containing protein [Acidobacteriota bacterium]
MSLTLHRSRRCGWRGVARAGVAILTVAIFSACSGKPDSAAAKGAAELPADLITRVSSGMLASHDTILVRFSVPVVEQARVGGVQSPDPFRFSPEIPGESRWRDPATLVFQPRAPLPLRTEYEGLLDLEKLNPQWAGRKPVKLKFAVGGREISQIEADFHPVTRRDPDFVVFRGEITLTEPVAADVVQSAVKLTLDGRVVPLQWEASGRNARYAFHSGDLDRPRSREIYVLTVSGKALELSGDYRRDFALNPVGRFNLEDVVEKDQGKGLALELRFSDPVDADADLAGLIRVRENEKDSQAPVTITHQVAGKSVYLGGNLVYGRRYVLEAGGVRSIWGTRMDKAVTRELWFADQKPRIAFESDGVFMTSILNRKLYFRTMNLSSVKLEIKKVFESNLGQFLQTEELTSRKERNDEFNSYQIERVGVPVISKDLAIGDVKNRWLTHELDLSALIPGGEKGLFLVELSFDRKAMLYSGPKPTRQYYYGTEYYSNPHSHGYLYRHGRVSKALIQSDIGLVYKSGRSGHLVWALDLRTARPMKGVHVMLRSYQHQVLAEGFTDNDGELLLTDVDGAPFYVEGEKDRQRSVISLKEMQWNLSAFNIGGVQPDARGGKAFVFSDRGVYRPGDTVHLVLIARNEDHTFPDNHPVTLTLSNPRRQPVYRITNKEGRDGFYRFDVQTRAEDLTGNWSAVFKVGDHSVAHTVRIETVVPFRLKVEFSDLPARLNSETGVLRCGLSAKYLFGSPAKNMAAGVTARVSERPLTPPTYGNMVFNNQAIRFQAHEAVVSEGNLDDRGEAAIDWKLPDLTGAPGALAVTLTASVQEKGGRSSRRTVSIPLDPFSRYVGIALPQSAGYTRVGAPLGFRVALVDPQGGAVSGRKLSYRILRNSQYWWWEYDSREEFRARFKKDSHTREIKSGELSSTSTTADLVFTPDTRGEYFLEIRDAAPGGHVAGIFFSSYHWGDAPAELENAGVLEIHCPRQLFAPGDIAEMSVDTPVSGRLLVAVEKGGRILRRFGMATQSGGETAFRIPVTADMLPNAYVSVALVQPLEQGENDRPLRMYGVIPVMVSDPSTRQELKLEVAEELPSGKEFSVVVQTGDQSATQVVLAVVDEGLLSLTDFASPDPWKFFFAKEGLGIKTFDLYSHVMGAHKGDLFRLFSIGGEMAEAYRESQLQPEEKKRFPPVALFHGPVMTDADGKVRVTFKMPNYIGAVRIMAVSAAGRRYGAVDRSVPVRTPLMVMPTMPRLLGPDDLFTVPVTVFAMEKGIRNVDVSLDVSGPVEVLPPRQRKLQFQEPGEQDTFFRVRVRPSTGTAQIRVAAKARKHLAEHTADIQVRPYSPRVSRVVVQETRPGGSVSLEIPGDGIPGTNQAVLSLSSRPRLQLQHRLGWLLGYPYGCIEQTVSAVFPQLMLLDFVQAGGKDRGEVDAHINDAIQRLKKFLLPSGGFSFWPGSNRLSVWGTTYAGHFLVEAGKLGYHVPEDLMSAWSRFEEQRAGTSTDNLMSRVYRIYVLSLAGKTPWSALNFLYENSLKDMQDVEKWMLAACYDMTGKPQVAKQILSGTGTRINPYGVPGETFGSRLRDKAVILEQATQLKRWPVADQLYDELVTELSEDTWLSTQTLGYALLAVGKYARSRGDKLTGELSLLDGRVQLPDGREKAFSDRKQRIAIPLTEGFGGTAVVSFSNKTESARCFASIEWSGVPLKPISRAESSNLDMEVRWLDSNGVTLDPRSLAQGTSFWGHFRIRSTWERKQRIENLALVQVMPSGWEIDNLRLSGDELPAWMQGFRVNRESYLDIRDDRVIWFFDLDREYLDFVVKLTAVVPGEYLLPPTLAEGMYDNRFRVVRPGGSVTVKD